jgi:hypothetical protein
MTDLSSTQFVGHVVGERTLAVGKLLATIAEIIKVVFLIALIIILLPIWLPVTLISNYTTNKWGE